ncbi:hypothetical protein HNY73_019105 [Argiope bruennichi]|uniref:ISXO2-like transposase domain-containing protein n=1 Tax=Argiope bruennichi TaxID=94029 RepID=A0A8T0EIK1_ARGBR|nr:hypothetical protein HNY73_019105 [Argiope bruennichi]
MDRVPPPSSVRKGSWFTRSHLSIPEALILTYLWVKETPTKWILDEFSYLSKPTLADWKSFCREVCMSMLVFCEYNKIGGVGVIVEIDESKFGKRKYNRGSIVLSDCWKAYNPLTAEGYVHHTVYHPKNFKDPITGVHTNSIEGTWSGIKSKMKKDGTNKCKDQFDSYLATYMFRRTYECSYRALFKVFFHDRVSTSACTFRIMDGFQDCVVTNLMT